MSHDHRTTLWESRAMSMINSVRWCFATSCDLVRPSNIILWYIAMLEIAARFLDITKPWLPRHRALTSDGCDVVRRCTTSHDSPPDGPRLPKFTPRWSTITKIYPSYDVVNAGVNVALTLVEHRIGSTLVIRGNIFAGLKWWEKWLLKSPHSIWTKSQVFPMLERGQCAVFVNIVSWNMFSGVTKCG